MYIGPIYDISISNDEMCTFFSAVDL